MLIGPLNHWIAMDHRRCCCRRRRFFSLIAVDLFSSGRGWGQFFVARLARLRLVSGSAIVLLVDQVAFHPPEADVALFARNGAAGSLRLVDQIRFIRRRYNRGGGRGFETCLQNGVLQHGQPLGRIGRHVVAGRDSQAHAQRFQFGKYFGWKERQGRILWLLGPVGVGAGLVDVGQLLPDADAASGAGS